MMRPQYRDPNWRSHPNVTRFNRIQVGRAMHDAIRILDHDIGQPTADYFEGRIGACEAWLTDPIGTTERTRTEIQSLLEILQSVRPIATHPHVLSIKQVAEATRRMADWVEELTDWDGWEEYGDVFELLVEILRCPKCYGGMFYNKVDRNTGRQFDWGTIARALVADKDLVLPDGYTGHNSIVGPPPRSDDSVELARSVRSVSLLLQIDYDAVAWQIIKHSVYMETPKGPKWSLRNGRWEQLAEHAHRIGSLLEPLTSRTNAYVDAEMRGTALPLLGAIKCTTRKWFDVFQEGQALALSTKGLELSRRLAETGDPRSDASLRSEPLFEMTGLTKELLESNMLIDESEDWSVDPNRAAAVEARSSQAPPSESVNDDNDASQTNEIEDSDIDVGLDSSDDDDNDDNDYGDKEEEEDDDDDDAESTSEIRMAQSDSDMVDLGPRPANERRSLFNNPGLPPPLNRSVQPTQRRSEPPPRRLYSS